MKPISIDLNQAILDFKENKFNSSSNSQAAILLDIYYFLESENRHLEIELLEKLTGLTVKMLEERIEVEY